MKTSTKRIVEAHPCLSEGAHGRSMRIHMPVAPRCNIQCRYCVRKFDCVNESRPGVTSRVFGAAEAFERLAVLASREERLRVLGVAGPGDPLANEATFELLRMVRRFLPGMILCISTNGLLLRDRLRDLLNVGVDSITVTVNAVAPPVAGKIYSHIEYDGHVIRGAAAAERLVQHQWLGIADAIEHGVIVKLNTIYIPGINDGELPLIAARAGHAGVEVMNIMPLIPQGAFAHLKRPACDDMDLMRVECGKHVRQMTHCKQCRADAFGLLGQDRDGDLELIYAGIGEDYCESVM